MINAWTLKRMKDRDYLFLQDGEISKPNGDKWLAMGAHDEASDARYAMFLVKFYRGNCIVRYINGIYYICDYCRCDTYTEARRMCALIGDSFLILH